MTNESMYLELLEKVDPELLKMKKALEATQTNPDLLIAIARAMSNLRIGSGYGTIRIIVQKGLVNLIEVEEKNRMSIKIEESKGIDFGV